MTDFNAGEIYLDMEVRAENLNSGFRRVERLATRSGQISSANFSKAFAAEKAGEKVGTGFSKGLKSASKGLGAAGQAVGGAITAADKLFTLTKKALDAASDIDRLSDQVGVGAEQFQELRFAAQQFGIEGDGVVGVLENMNREVGEFINTGKGGAVSALEAIGLSNDLASGKIAGTLPIFDAIVDKLGNVKNAQQRAALAAQIFGTENGTKLNNLLNQGSAGIAGLRKEARELGIVLADIDVKNAAAANLALDKLGTTLRANVNRAIVQAAPQIEEFTNKLIELAPKIFDWASIAVDGFIALADGIEHLQDKWNASFLGKGEGEPLPTTDLGIRKRLRELETLKNAIVAVEKLNPVERIIEKTRPFSLVDTKDRLGTNIFDGDVFDPIKNDPGALFRLIGDQQKKLNARLEKRPREIESTDSRLLDPTTQSGKDQRVFDLENFLQDLQDDVNGVLDAPLNFEQIGFDLFGKETFERLSKNSINFEEAIKAEIERITNLDIANNQASPEFPSAEIDQSVITRENADGAPADLGQEFADMMQEVGKEIDAANQLFEQSRTPIELYQAELEKLAALQSSPVLAGIAGGEAAFSRARVDAVEELASATGSYEDAIDELVRLSAAGEISAEDFGRGFQNVTDNVETAGAAIVRLNKIGDAGAISPEAQMAGVEAIKKSADYQKDLNDEQKKALDVKITELDLLAQEVAAELQLAELRGQIAGEDGIEKKQRELDILREQIDLLRRGVNPDEVETQAIKIIDTKENAELQGQLRDSFKGAFRAALDGDFEGFLSNKLKNAAANMFDRALDGLFDALFSGLGNLGGSGGGVLDSIFKGFAGAFASGGVIGNGRFGLVGENGPELVSAGSGPIRITPLDGGLSERFKGISTAGLESRGSNQQGGSNIVMNIAGVKDLASFVKSQGSIESDMAAALRRAQSDF